jgi:hypothetical protein
MFLIRERLYAHPVFYFSQLCDVITLTLLDKGLFFEDTIRAYEFRICLEQKVVGTGEINLFRSTEGNKP